MKSTYHRLLPLILALVMVVTLLPVMPLTAKAAYPNQTITIPDVDRDQKSPATYPKAVTYDDVTAIVEDYWNTVTHNTSRMVYWNKHIRVKESIKNMAFNDTVTTTACKKPHKHDGDSSPGTCPDRKGDTPCTENCQSNAFHDPSFSSQCRGFAYYMAYVVFKSSCGSWAKYTTTELPADYQLKEGDIVWVQPSWSTSSTAEASHMRFVYKVENGIAYMIDCNGDGQCKINAGDQFGVKNTKKAAADVVAHIRSTAGAYLLCSPAVASVSSYTVAYNANGGTGTMEDTVAAMDKTYTLRMNTFTKIGYTFDGWNTEADGSGTSYADGASFTNLTTTDKAQVTLYAQWKVATYTIAYDANGGTGYMSNTVATVDEAGTLSKNIFIRSGYTFNGWNTEADGSGTSYADGATFLNLATTDQGQVTLYAQWKPYGESMPTGSCGENLTWTLDDAGTLTISGTGPMTNYENTVDTPWYPYQLDYKITHVEIQDGVTSIGDFAFCNTGLTTITIPDSITSIGDSVFFYCINLKEIDIPDGVTHIGEYAFSLCFSLEEIAIPENVTGIGDFAFAYCIVLEEIVVPESVTSIGYGVFEGCSNLSKITFCGNAPAFGEDVFTEVTATAYYPAGDPTWTEDVMLGYGGNITWIAVEQTEVLLGDVTGDGKVTAADYSRLLAHVKKVNLITDEATLKAADVTGDGKVTAADYSRLLAHVKKVSPLW